MMSVNKSQEVISYHLFRHNETDSTTIIFTKTDSWGECRRRRERERKQSICPWRCRGREVEQTGANKIWSVMKTSQKSSAADVFTDLIRCTTSCRHVTVYQKLRVVLTELRGRCILRNNVGGNVKVQSKSVQTGACSLPIYTIVL